jgi:predicted O-linked N-acetylglucosamine transferase (SPINDLY family)
MDGKRDPVVEDLKAVIRQIAAGELKSAMDGCAAMMRADPQCAPALHMMGIVAARMGDQGLALSLAERAHAIEPDYREYPAVLAYLCATVGRVTDALYYAKLATVLAPHPLGELLMPDSLPMSRAVFDHVSVSMHWLLAEAAYFAGKYEEAAREAEAELRLNPERYDTLVLLGRARQGLGAHELAIAHLRAAARIRPEAALAHRWIGDVLLSLGEHDQALASFRLALELETEDDALAAAHVASRLPLQSDANLGASASLAADLRDRAVGQRRPAAIDESSSLIGVLWDQCHAGPLVDFILPVLEHLSDVVLYRLGRRTDQVTEALRGKVMRFQDCPDLDAATFDRIIAGDRPGALINLCTSTDEARFPRLTGAAAPPLVQWLGMPMPERMPGAERIIGAPVTAPADRALFGEEAILTLPHLLAWRFPGTGDAAEAVQSSPRQANGHVTFGVMGDMRRITPDTVALWAQALRSAPGAKLLVGGNGVAWPQPIVERLGGMFANFGLVDRVSLQGPMEMGPVNFDFFSRIDILLDTAPVNGMNELAEALWMGVPAVTLAGHRRAGRIGAAILDAAGRAEWIAATPAEFAALAAALADRADLAQLREGLRDQVAASPLCDLKGFAESFKAALLAAPLRSAHAA